MLAGEVNVPLGSASFGMECRHLTDIHESRRTTGPLIVVPTLGACVFYVRPKAGEHALDLLDRVANPLVLRHLRRPFGRGTLEIELQQPPRPRPIVSAGPNLAGNIGRGEAVQSFTQPVPLFHLERHAGQGSVRHFANDVSFLRRQPRRNLDAAKHGKRDGADQLIRRNPAARAVL